MLTPRDAARKIKNGTLTEQDQFEDPNAKVCRQSLLHYACSSSNNTLEMVRLVVSKGTNMDLTNSDGKTPEQRTLKLAGSARTLLKKYMAEPTKYASKIQEEQLILKTKFAVLRLLAELKYESSLQAAKAGSEADLAQLKAHSPSSGWAALETDCKQGLASVTESISLTRKGRLGIIAELESGPITLADAEQQFAEWGEYENKIHRQINTPVLPIGLTSVAGMTQFGIHNSGGAGCGESPIPTQYSPPKSFA